MWHHFVDTTTPTAPNEMRLDKFRGTLKSVDQYLNIKLDNAEAVDMERWPHLARQDATFKILCDGGLGLMNMAVLDKRHVHPRQRGALRAPAVGRRRHSVARGRDAEGNLSEWDTLDEMLVGHREDVQDLILEKRLSPR